jgi:hypothetical protein
MSEDDPVSKIEDLMLRQGWDEMFLADLGWHAADMYRASATEFRMRLGTIVPDERDRRVTAASWIDPENPQRAEDYARRATRDFVEAARGTAGPAVFVLGATIRDWKKRADATRTAIGAVPNAGLLVVGGNARDDASAVLDALFLLVEAMASASAAPAAPTVEAVGVAWPAAARVDPAPAPPVVDDAARRRELGEKVRTKTGARPPRIVLVGGLPDKNRELSERVEKQAWRDFGIEVVWEFGDYDRHERPVDKVKNHLKRTDVTVVGVAFDRRWNATQTPPEGIKACREAQVYGCSGNFHGAKSALLQVEALLTGFIAGRTADDDDEAADEDHAQDHQAEQDAI